MQGASLGLDQHERQPHKNVARSVAEDIGDQIWRNV